MAYLDNTVITVDAVLTKLGRERLSQTSAGAVAGETSAFRITKWAVADDEIDYTLYNTAHPLGTDYYSNTIENMPILEAIPDESQALRYKLRTGQVGEKLKIPVIFVNNQDSPIAIISPKTTTSTPSGYRTAEFTPTTKLAATVGGTNDFFDGSNGNGENYILTLFNEKLATLVEGSGTTFVGNISAGEIGNYSTTMVRTLPSNGKFIIQANPLIKNISTTKLRITGETTGATVTYTITITPES